MKKILLVNSTRHFYADGESLLDRKDFQVFKAPTAEYALDIHRREHVDLIVSDLDLPEMGGDILCAKVRDTTDCRDVSIILICHDRPEERSRANRASANVCLVKPFPAQTLLDMVEKLLDVAVRKSYRMLLRARVEGDHDDVRFFCSSVNISSTGMLIESSRALANGDCLCCSFCLPDSTQVKVNGEVVRRVDVDGRTCYGLRFLEVPKDVQRAIDSFIAQATAVPAGQPTSRPRDAAVTRPV